LEKIELNRIVYTRNP